MAYFPPYIDDTGFHTPIYEDILNEMISKMQQVYGNDIYLDEDSMDYQMLSIFARKVFDTYSAAQLAYNNRTPITSIGVGLDNVSVFANIKRKPATNSTAQLTITGNPSTLIQNGIASDGTYNWNLPETVSIPGDGTIIVEAICAVEGNISAAPNTITEIVTPVYGWSGVTNNYAAEPGQNVESDASLRGRFAKATQTTSDTVFDGILAGIQSVSGVERVVGYENDTGSTSDGTTPPNVPSGLPAHSVTFVVEGGDEDFIANEIYTRKTPGCYTNGTTSVQINSYTGNVSTIRFYRPTDNPIYVQVNIKSLLGYTSDYVDQIKAKIVDYISSMAIGETLYQSVVWSIAMSAMADLGTPAYSVQSVKFSSDGTTFTAADVTQDFYDVFTIDASDITVGVT